MIVSPPKSTVIARDGAVRSVQSAELTLAQEDFKRMWNATNLENLARTYWLFLSRVTARLIRVVYGENERSVVFLGRPLTLLRFDAPEYVLERDHGKVSWRIRDGLLVARAGRGCGFLSLDVSHLGDEPDGRVQGPDRGRGRELLSRDRRRLQHARVRGDPVRDPRARDARVPALAGDARPRAVEGRPLRRRPRRGRAAGRAAIERARHMRDHAPH